MSYVRLKTLDGPCKECGTTIGPFWRTDARALQLGVSGIPPLEPRLDPVRCDHCEERSEDYLAEIVNDELLQALTRDAPLRELQLTEGVTETNAFWEVVAAEAIARGIATEDDVAAFRSVRHERMKAAAMGSFSGSDSVSPGPKAAQAIPAEELAWHLAHGIFLAESHVALWRSFGFKAAPRRGTLFDRFFPRERNRA